MHLWCLKKKISVRFFVVAIGVRRVCARARARAQNLYDLYCIAIECQFNVVIILADSKQPTQCTQTKLKTTPTRNGVPLFAIQLDASIKMNSFLLHARNKKKIV